MWVTSNHVNCSRRNPKTQWKVCLSYWNTGILYCTCKHFLHKARKPIRNSSIIRWTFFQSLSMWSRSEDIMDIEMVKSHETKNIIWLTNWKRNAKRKSSKESTTDSYTIKHFVFQRKSSRRALSTMGCSCGWRPHSPFDTTRVPPLKEDMAASFKEAKF